jgi:hypothetical protein
MLTMDDMKGKPAEAPAEDEAVIIPHSRLGPSSSKRWINCTGSHEATKDMPDTDSIYALEGTAAHHLSDMCRSRNQPAKNFHGQIIKVERVDGGIEEFTVDHEMVDAVQRYVDYCNQFEGTELELFEERVTYDAWVEGGFGTGDDIRVGEGIVRITDLKYGKGVMEFAEGNTQLLLYALGVYQDWAHTFEMEKFILTIHQPRLDHVDVWEIDVHYLLNWANTVAQPKALEALSGNGTLAAGDWCQFCPAKAICGTRAEWIANQDFEPLEDNDPAMMNDDEIAELLKRKATALAFWKDLEEYAFSRLQQGHPVGDFKLVEGRSNRRWRNEEEAEKALRKAKYKVSEIFTKKLITAPAAEKLVGKNHDIMKTQVVKPQGKPVMVPGTDKRPPYQPKAEDEFDDISNES